MIIKCPYCRMNNHTRDDRTGKHFITCRGCEGDFMVVLAHKLEAKVYSLILDELEE